MFAALLTSFLFAISGIFGRRSTLYLGSQRANLARQIVALILLGLWAHTRGQGLNGMVLLFFLSGVVGFGLGGWALFEAYPRIGAGLTILLSQCLATLFAAVIERLWLGTAMTILQMAGSAVILAGVVLAIAPSHQSDIPAGHRLAGTLYGVIAAVGQSWGAVLSRDAFHRAKEAGFYLDGMTAAYQRLWGGVLSITLLLILSQITCRWHEPKEITLRPDWKQGWPWVLATAVTGAVLGSSCYQWALKSTPSAIVLSIVATAPLMVMIMEFAFEGVRPTPRTVFGAVLAVSGVVALVLNS